MQVIIPVITGENINKVTFESGERNDKYLFSGKKSSVLIQNWELEVNSTGEEILKIPFTFTNKTNKTINMKLFRYQYPYYLII